jgi:hypothetical protein
VLGLVFKAKIVGKPSIPLTLILSHQGRGKKKENGRRSG